MPRILEEQLILPALYLMDTSPDKTISMSDLIIKLFNIFKPTGIDASTISGRRDTHFSQKVRNLKSHNTLVNLGYAIYNARRQIESSGSFTLSESGKDFLDANMNVLNYLLDNDFNSEDLKKAFGFVYDNRESVKIIQTFDENITINEGTKFVSQTNVYQRSKKLREEAIRYYTIRDRIKCRACFFDYPADGSNLHLQVEKL